MPSKRNLSRVARSILTAAVAVGAAAAAAMAAGKAAAPVFSDGQVLGSHGLKDEVTSNIYGGPAVQLSVSCVRAGPTLTRSTASAGRLAAGFSGSQSQASPARSRSPST